jgi:hypothetical protein
MYFLAVNPNIPQLSNISTEIKPIKPIPPAFIERIKE